MALGKTKVEINAQKYSDNATKDTFVLLSFGNSDRAGKNEIGLHLSSIVI